MKKLMIIINCVFVATVALYGQKTDYEKIWNHVDSLYSLSYTQSAYKLADSALVLAKKEKNSFQILQSTVRMSQISTRYMESYFDSSLVHLQSILPLLDKTDKSVCYALIANCLNEIWNSVQWKISPYSDIINPINGNYMLWPTQQFKDTIQQYLYLSVMSYPEILQKTSVQKYNSFFEEGNKEGFLLRPTLYDILIQNVFLISQPYTSEELETMFSVIQNSNLFGVDSQFMEVELPKERLFWKMRLLQFLTQFHKNDSFDIRAHITLQRIQYLENCIPKSDRSLKKDFFVKGMEQNIKYYKQQTSYVTNFYYELASYYNGLEQKIKAMTYCDTAFILYPQSEGSIHCYDLCAEIRKPYLNLQANVNAILLQKNLGKLQYKNMDTVYFKMISYIDKLDQRSLYYNQDSCIILINQQPSLIEWQQINPRFEDYKMHVTDFILPAMEAGKYIIIASNNRKFEGGKNLKTACYAKINYTDIDVVQINWGNGIYEGYVVNRKTGFPILNAQIKLYKIYKEQQFIKNIPLQKKGYFHISNLERGNYELKIHFGKSEYALQFYNYVNENKKSRNVTNLFTDRGVYKPGEEVYFKSILYQTNGLDSGNVIAREKVTVDFKSASGETLDTLNLLTDDFGSVSGRFKIPQNALPGYFAIELHYGLQVDNVYKAIKVESYKQPTFIIAFEKNNTMLRLNKEVTVKGNVISYTQVPISNSLVRYKITRASNMPYWKNYNIDFDNTREETIVSSATSTDALGNFSISFDALPNLTVDSSMLPYYTYTISVSVTDGIGETQTGATSLRIGSENSYVSSEVSSILTFNDSIPFSYKNLNGERLKGKITVTLDLLKVPNPVRLPNPLDPEKEFVSHLSSSDFYKWFPYYSYAGDDNMDNWQVLKTVYSSSFITTTDKETFFKLPNLKSGVYRVTFATKEEGKTIMNHAFFTFLPLKKGTILPNNDLLFVYNSQKRYEVGDTADVWLASKFSDIQVYYTIFSGQASLEKGVLLLNRKLQKLSIPVTKEMLGGFQIAFATICENSVASKTIDWQVPFTKKKLNIKFSTFRNKLQPGKLEEWRLRVTNYNNKVIDANMVTSLYDAALDVYQQNIWDFSPWEEKYPKNLQMFISKNLQIQTINSLEDQSLIKVSLPVYYQLPELFYLKINPKYDHSRFTFVKGGRKSIIGRVIDAETYKPKSLVSVVVFQKGEQKEATVSDFNGFFNIQLPDTGYYDIRIMHAGFRSVFMDGINVVDSAITTIGSVRIEPSGIRSRNYPMLSASNKRNFLRKGNVDSEMEAVEYDMTAGYFSMDAPITTSEEEKINTPQLRTHLCQTAFFYPNLYTDTVGDITISFTAPELLTQWNFKGLAYTQDLKYGEFLKTVITQKELMVQPNVPRFFRQGDTLDFMAKVSNLSGKKQQVTVILEMLNPMTEKSIQGMIQGNFEQHIMVDTLSSTNINFRLIVPDTIYAAMYRITAVSESFSDGEQNVISVLSNRTMITESMSMYINGKEDKNYIFQNFAEKEQSTTIQNYSLTLEFSSNPLWYAIQALPYLLEKTNPSNEQLFSRWYAAQLGSYIVQSHSQIEKIFKQWQDLSPDTFMSQLEKNQELKQTVLTETPWLLDAQNERESKRRVAEFFKTKELTIQIKLLEKELQENQNSDGGFSWMKGYPSSEIVTQWIVRGIGELIQMGVLSLDKMHLEELLRHAIDYLDRENASGYTSLKNRDVSLDYRTIGYLYARSFFKEISFLKDTEIAYDSSYRYFKKYALKYENLYAKAMLALVFQRNGDEKLAKQLIRSLKETALYSSEMGMYWRDNISGYFWYQAPISTQTMLIQAFRQITDDTVSVSKMQQWLLKQKQTTHWNTSMSTANAIYALLIGNAKQLTDTVPVMIMIGSKEINSQSQAGSGYIKQTWKSEFTPQMANVTLKKTTDGIAWGALYWQYFDNIDNISSANNGITLNKQLYQIQNTNHGEILIPIEETTLRIGDKIRVRIQIYCDRNLEYLQLKDMRASCFEPVSTMSGYRWNAQFSYYLSVENTVTNFYIYRLNKGFYTVEYDMWVTNSGDFSNGFATMQCMYAPEFRAISNGIRIKIK